MADKKRQREEDKKLKEAKRQRVAEMQRQQKEATEKLQAEKELKRKATMDAKIKALKELKEEQGNARIRAVRSKSNSSDDINASRSSREDDLKVQVSFSSFRGLEFFRDETEISIRNSTYAYR
ncbi:hypothetical protein Rs2_45656 [Raphanus sativus]|nr:hypothetical protein Rs2_45656 [Raphanus sativus]